MGLFFSENTMQIEQGLQNISHKINLCSTSSTLVDLCVCLMGDATVDICDHMCFDCNSAAPHAGLS